MGKSALVVGGTGPTGPHVLNGLLERDFDVTIFHRGTHEPDDLPDVRHIHGDPHFRQQIAAAMGDNEYDVVIATYGRTRYLAEAFVGRTQRFLAVGGPPRYVGFYYPSLVKPYGLAVPVREDAPLVEELDPDALAPIRFSGQLVNTERAVFSAHPTATYFIYPAVYGPRNVVPIEWSVIKRCLDGRTEMVLPDGGLSINSRGAPQNLAHFLLLAIDRPDTSEGQIFNCADDALYSLRQWIQLVLDAMGSTMNIVGVPSEIAPLFRAIYLPPSQHQSPHYVFDTTKARERLGYRDVISPHDAIIESVEWYHSHPVDAAAPPAGFVDRFDYQLEESLIDAWRRAVGDVQAQVPQTIQPEVHSMPHPKVPNQLLDERSR